MNAKIWIILFLCTSQTVFGQDTLQITTEIDTTFKNTKYFIAYGDADLANQVTTRMFKFDPLSWLLFGNESASQLKLEYEHKLNPSLSVNAAIGFQGAIVGSTFLTRNMYSSFSWVASIEPRWYLGMAEKVRKKQAANNLSGNYIGVRLSTFITPSGWANTAIEQKTLPDSLITAATQSRLMGYRLELNYGIQRRLFKRGYVTFSFGGGVALEEGIRVDNVVTKTLSTKTLWRPFVNNKVSFGWVFGGDSKNSKTNVTQCDLFRCFEEEGKLFKINLLGLAKILDLRNVATETTASYEFWLNKENSFSLNSSLYFRGEYLKAPPSELNSLQKAPSWLVETGARIEGRYYYNLQKRIASGKSAQNFSANYWGLPIDYSHSNYVTTSKFVQDPKTTETTFKIGFVYGAQRRLFKNGYLDLNLGPAYKFDLVKNQCGFSALGKIELGLAF
jgi:hypothetical protein